MFGCVADFLIILVPVCIHVTFFRGVIMAVLSLSVLVKSFRNRLRTRISEKEEVRDKHANRLAVKVDDRFSAHSREETKTLLSA